MAQNTAQGIAYQQLKPTEGGNLGAIVEERIRYWSKFDADEKAKAEALAAQQREYERKLNKDKDDRFKNVMPLLDRGEAEGYLADQYVKVVEMNEDEVYKLAQEWKENGNQDSYLKLKRKKEQADSASKISSTLTTAVTTSFKGLDKNPDYNPYLDAEKLRRVEILTGSGWTFDKDFNVIMIDPEDPKNTITQTANEALNYWRTAKFSGNPDFDGIGTTIAESIKLFDNNGNKIKRGSNVNDGVMGWRNALKDNNLVLDTAVVKYKDELGEIKDNTLNESQLDKLGRLLYDEYTDHKIQESARRAPERTPTPAKPTLELITDTNGKPVNEYEVDGTINTLPEGTTVFRTTEKINNFIDAKGNVITQPVLIKKPNGDFQVRGKSETIVTEPVLDDNGNPVPKTQGGIMVPDGEGGYLTETRNRKVYNDITIDDDVSMDIFVRQIENPLTKQNFRNLEEASKYTNQVIPSKTTVPSNQPVKFN